MKSVKIEAVATGGYGRKQGIGYLKGRGCREGNKASPLSEITDERKRESPGPIIENLELKLKGRLRYDAQIGD